MRMTLSSASLIGLAALLGVVQSQTCPPEGLEALSTLDAASFISAPWFIVEQIPLFFAPFPQNFFCVRAEYTAFPQGQKPLGCLGPRCNDFLFFDVFNSGNIGTVDGPPIQSNLPPTFKGVQRDPAAGGEFRIGPQVLPEQLWSNLFVFAAGTFDELLTLDVSELAQEPRSLQYDWAIVSNDAPDIPTPNGCLPGEGPFNIFGFFLYSRDPSPPAELVTRIKDVADFLGYDVTALRPVIQEGCVFPQAP